MREETFMTLGKIKGKNVLAVMEPDGNKLRPVFCCSVERILKLVREGERAVKEYDEQNRSSALKEIIK